MGAEETTVKSAQPAGLVLMKALLSVSVNDKSLFCPMLIGMVFGSTLMCPGKLRL